MRTAWPRRPSCTWRCARRLDAAPSARPAVFCCCAALLRVRCYPAQRAALRCRSKRLATEPTIALNRALRPRHLPARPPLQVHRRTRDGPPLSPAEAKALRARLAAADEAVARDRAVLDVEVGARPGPRPSVRCVQSLPLCVGGRRGERAALARMAARTPRSLPSFAAHVRGGCAWPLQYGLWPLTAAVRSPPRTCFASHQVARVQAERVAKCVDWLRAYVQDWTAGGPAGAQALQAKARRDLEKLRRVSLGEPMAHAIGYVYRHESQRILGVHGASRPAPFFLGAGCAHGPRCYGLPRACAEACRGVWL